LGAILGFSWLVLYHTPSIASNQKRCLPSPANWSGVARWSLTSRTRPGDSASSGCAGDACPGVSFRSGWNATLHAVPKRRGWNRTPKPARWRDTFHCVRGVGGVDAWPTAIKREAGTAGLLGRLRYAARRITGQLDYPATISAPAACAASRNIRRKSSRSLEATGAGISSGTGATCSLIERMCLALRHAEPVPCSE